METGKNAKGIKDKGFALLLVMFIILFLSSIVASISVIFITDVKIIENYQNQVKALYVADAGIEYAISRLVLDDEWSANKLSVEFPGGSGNFYVITKKKNDDSITSEATLSGGTVREYEAEIEITGSESPYEVKLTGWRDTSIEEPGGGGWWPW
jgi:hypothetical protein